MSGNSFLCIMHPRCIELSARRKTVIAHRDRQWNWNSICTGTKNFKLQDKPQSNPIPAKPSMLWPADLFPHIAIANGGAIEFQLQRTGLPQTYNRQFMLPVLVHWLPTAGLLPTSPAEATSSAATATVCQMTFAGRLLKYGHGGIWHLACCV